MSREEPRVSADGRFYWDGAKWVPLSTNQSDVNRTAGAIVIAGAVITVVGCFLPAIEITAPFVGTISRSYISSGDGAVVAGIALFAGLLGLLLLIRRVGIVVPIVLLLAVLGAGWAIAVDYLDASRRLTSLPSLAIGSVGAGLYAAAFGIVVLAAGTVVAFRRPAPLL